LIFLVISDYERMPVLNFHERPPSPSKRLVDRLTPASAATCPLACRFLTASTRRVTQKTQRTDQPTADKSQ